jgi:hypothetical protein
MQRPEIITEIDQHDGTWHATEEITFTKHRHDKKGVTAIVEGIPFWLMGHLDEASDFFVDPGHTHATLDRISAAYEAAQKLAHFLGYEMPGAKVVTITNTVTAPSDRSEEMRLLGKVEAYEKILIGREISAKA